MPVSAGTRLGPYEIVAPLGAGGMGEVYRARDSRLDRDVALKVLPADFAADTDRLRRFAQEARHAAALNHPNIVSIHDIGADEGLHYVVMELVEGESLRVLLRRGPLPLRKLVDNAVQLADGLAAAHTAGIMHRDLKPENVMITREGRAKILDFGLAKQAGRARSAASDATEVDTGTQPGTVLGTSAYMSPEQARGEPVDFRSDLFSFGLLLYEMASGKKAFQRNSAPETLTAIIRDEPVPLQSAVPAPLRWTIDRCLAKDAAERYESTRDLYQELRHLRDHLSEAATGIYAGGQRPTTARRRAGWLLSAAVVAGAVLFVLAVGALTYSLGRRAAGHTANYQQITFRRGMLQNARFAPDGQTVLYSGEWQGDPHDVFEVRPGMPDSRSLGLTGNTIAAVSKEGELAVITGCDRVMLWAFCTGTLARLPLTGGSPRALAEKAAFADWTPDGKALAAVFYDQKAFRLEYPLGKVLYQTSGWLAAPRFSPDGKHIAFLEHPLHDDDRGWVAVTDLQGKTRKIGGEWSSLEGLAWSPDASEIWFSSATKGYADTIYAVTLSGRIREVAKFAAGTMLQDISPTGRVLFSSEALRNEVRGLFAEDHSERDLSWFDASVPSDFSGNGKLILFSEAGAAGGSSYRTYLRRTDGSPAVFLGEGYGGSFSPDARWVANKTPMTPPSLNLLPTGAGESRTLERGGIEAYGGWNTGFAWRPNGKEILFIGRKKEEDWKVFRQDISGGPPTPVLPASFRPHGLCLSPEGEWLLALGADERVYRIPIAGGAPADLNGLDSRDVPLLWSSDGRSIYTVRTAEPGRTGYGLPAKVFRFTVSTGRKQLWKEMAPPDATGVPAITKIVLARDESSYMYYYARYSSQLFLASGLR